MQDRETTKKPKGVVEATGQQHYRLVVCFDFTAISLIDAYRKLRRTLRGGSPRGFLGWETSDEFYVGAAEDGDVKAGDPRELQHAIASTLGRKRRSR